jgi:chemotaxis protein MotC
VSRLARILAFAAASTAAVAGGSAAAADQIEPYLMVRSLQLVQDRIAIGDHAAMPMQRKLLELIDRRLREASAAELMQPRNLNFLMVYAMSGGNPETLRSLARRMHLAEREGKLIAGITSYLNGATKTAALTLKDFEPMQEPIEIGAFLALLRGSVISLEDPASALKLFDQARLLAPGTLVEEAALRRSVALTATLGDPERFVRLSEQFVRSYLRSPYASQFADAFVSGVLSLQASLDLSAIDGIVDMMAEEQRKVIYLRIARRAAIDGLVELSNYASRKADAVGGAQADASDPRVLLYTSLTDITTAPIEEIRQRLGRIDRDRLSASDLKLLDAVLAVNGAITKAPDASAQPQPLAEESPQIVDAPEPLDPAKAAVPLEPAAPKIATTETDHSGGDSVPDPEDHAVAAPPADPAPPPAEAAGDPTDALLAAGRRRLAEIDALLAETAE